MNPDELAEVAEDLEQGLLDEQEMEEVLAGRYGPELQVRAAELAGVELVDEDGFSASDHEWASEMVAAQTQLEKRMGRELTAKETDALASHYSPEFGVPDPDELGEAFEELTGRDASGSFRDKDARQEIAVEAYEDAERAKAEQGVSEE